MDEQVGPPLNDYMEKNQALSDRSMLIPIMVSNATNNGKLSRAKLKHYLLYFKLQNARQYMSNQFFVFACYTKSRFC